MNSLLSTQNDYFVMDSFPIEIGKIYRENQLNLTHNYGIQLKGYNASKNSYFLGFKITLLIDNHGNIHYFSIDKASVHDLTVAREFLPPIEKAIFNKTIFCDKAYMFKADEQQAYRNNFTEFKIPQKIYKSMTNEEKIIIKKSNKNMSKYRKYIETINALIVSLLGKKIHATNLNGFIFKLQILIFNFQILRSFK